MHKNYLLLLCTLLWLSSCQSKEDKLLNDIRGFVAAAEQDYKSYTELDWQKSNATIADLSRTYEALRPGMTDQQRAIANEEIGKYRALQLKGGLNQLNEIKNNIMDIGNQVKGALEELTDTTSKY